MRIIHVSDCYWPRVGGVESQLRDLTRAQVQDGHEVHVLTVELGAQGERGGVIEEDEGVAIHRLGMRLPLRAPFNPMAGEKASALIEELSPDVVHVHAGVLCPLALRGAVTALGLNLPVAVTWHSVLDGMGPLIRRWEKVTDWPDASIALSAVSQVAADQVADTFGTPVDVVHNGVDLADWVPDETSDDLFEPLRCAATMRLVPAKRTIALIEALSTALDDLGPGAITLDLFGDGPDRWRVKRRIRRLGLEDVVTLHGETSRDELRRAYQTLQVFCVPSTKEAFGIAALEARAAGLVVLGRAGTGIETFLRNGEDAVLVDSDLAMSRALARLARDRERVARLRRETLSTLPPFDLRDVVARTMTEYRRALDSQWSRTLAAG